MRQFIAGVIVTLLAVVGAAVFWLRKKTSRVATDDAPGLKQLEELGKLTGELAHEIKNPLSTIKINLKLASEELRNSARDTNSTQRALRKISVIQKETDRLGQILDGFLRYADRSELQLARVDINSLVSDMVDFYTPQCYSHSITLRQLLCEQALVCKVDTDMLKQVMLNLFINSQQAMSTGGELMVRTESTQGYAMIIVSDTGSGIDEDKLVHIFDAHYSSRSQGSGLGLATAKRIVQDHGGTISVDSVSGKGTLFTIKLPLMLEEKT